MSIEFDEVRLIELSNESYTARGAVLRILPKMGSQEFTSRNILEIIHEYELYEFKCEGLDDQRSRISSVLSSLVSKGIIKRIRGGAGALGNLYRVIK